MEAVRFFTKHQWDNRLGRFSSVAFRNSSNNTGISVIDRKCAIDCNRTICAHILAYYSPPAEHPIIFWSFDKSLLPSEVVVQQSNSSSGDICHYNIIGFTDKQARSFMIANTKDLQSISICVDGQERPIERRDLVD